MLSWVEHEKEFYNHGPWTQDTSEIHQLIIKFGGPGIKFKFFILIISKYCMFKKSFVIQMPYNMSCLHEYAHPLLINGIGYKWQIFPSFLQTEIKFVTSCLLCCTGSAFWKEVYFKKKEFAPIGSKFFPFRVDPFQKGGKTILIELSSLKVYAFLLKYYKKKKTLHFSKQTCLFVSWHGLRTFL